MTVPSHDDIRGFITRQYDDWNEGKRDELLAEYDRIAPGGYTIQYYRQEVAEGRPTLEAMFDTYNGKVRTIVERMFVNDGEAHVIVRGEVVGTDDYHFTVESYRFADGRMTVSYFNDAEHHTRQS